MNQSILIVEDEEKIARLLEIELEFEGYQVCKEKNGIDGLETYCKGHWDLVLLDIMIPGLSGIELLRRIRKDDASIPVILLTVPKVLLQIRSRGSILELTIILPSPL